MQKQNNKRSDTESTQRHKSIAVFILLPISNIPAIFDDAFDSNQTYLTAISPSSYEAAITYLNICKKKNIQDLVKLNILCILTNAYDKNQVNNIFYRALY